jgi:hypothetical protein
MLHTKWILVKLCMILHVRRYVKEFEKVKSVVVI